MPHRSFGTVRAGVEREPITFDFGLYGEDTFTVLPEPSLGDTFDLADAPEPDTQNMLEAARAIAKFLRKMIAPEDRHRFDQALYRIPATQCHVIVEAGMFVAEQVSGFPTEPPSNSSAGRPPTGTRSKKPRAGTARLKT